MQMLPNKVHATARIKKGRFNSEYPYPYVPRGKRLCRKCWLRMLTV